MGSFGSLINAGHPLQSLSLGRSCYQRCRGPGRCHWRRSLCATPVNGFSKAKARLDALMAAELGAEPPPFVLHDIRRTVRTRMSGFASSDVAELVIAHTRPGLRRVYDLHSFEQEKRDALDKWAARLRRILEPPPANVVDINREKARG